MADDTAASRPRFALGTRYSVLNTRFGETLDALAPHAIALAALIVAEGAWPATQPGTAAVVVAVVALAVGTAWRFFRPLPHSHATWPVALALLGGLFPLMAMHGGAANAALLAPVPIHLLPLGFTYTAITLVALSVAAYVVVMTREQPRWAGVVFAPVALALAWLPVLALRPTETQWFVAAIGTFAVAEVAAGVGWFLPERMRWFPAPLALAAGAWLVLRDDVPPNTSLPGRPLLLIDAGLILFFAALTLAAPLLCWWLTRPRPRPAPDAEDED